jgi:hypothetical protein
MGAVGHHAADIQQNCNSFAMIYLFCQVEHALSKRGAPDPGCTLLTHAGLVCHRPFGQFGSWQSKHLIARHTIHL